MITVEQLKKFSGVFADDDATASGLMSIYIGSATDIIASYVGFDPEEEFETIPDIFKLVCLEISTLILQEEGSNIGVNSKSFAEGGSRSFLNVVNYEKYLARLSKYRKNDALKM